MLHNTVKTSATLETKMTPDEMKACVGRDCYVLESCPDWNWNDDRRTTIVLVDFMTVQKPKPSSGSEHILTFKVLNPDGRQWWVHPDCIRLLKPLAPVKPYPNTCNVCHSPARKGAGVVLCSNVKCKNAKRVRQLLPKNAKDIIFIGIDDQNNVICPTCGQYSIGASIIGADPIFKVTCVNKHTWNHKFEIGHIVCSGGTKYVWSPNWKLFGVDSDT